jgi:ankyrin repeat protein
MGSVAHDPELAQHQQHQAWFLDDGTDLGTDAGPDADDDADDAGNLDRVLELQQKVDEYELEMRKLRAQIDSQRFLLQQMQQEALMSVRLRGVASSAEQHQHPLIQAAGSGDALMVAILIDNGADPRMHGDAALLVACQRGHHAVAEMLLERGACVHVDHDSPLLWAAERGDVILATLLIKHGARCVALDNLALRIAVRKGDHEMAKLLLSSGCSC